MSYPNTIVVISLIFLMGCTEDKAISLDLEHTPQQVELFGEDFISTRLYERDIAISKNGEEIIFTLGNYKQTHRSLVSVKKDGNSWGAKKVLPFSGRYNDIEPFLSVDGDRLFFASDRPMDSDTTRTDYNIWVAERSGSKWKDPTPLDTLVNTSKDEFFPSVSRNGNLYFTATREGGIGREDIFLSTFTNNRYGAPTVLDSTINTTVFEFNAYVNPDETLLIFSSFGRKDGLGGGDLYYSLKDGKGKWGAAKNMGEIINSEKLDYCPFVDVPRGNFYFTSDRVPQLDKNVKTISDFEQEADAVLNGMGNIYRIGIEELNIE